MDFDVFFKGLNAEMTFHVSITLLAVTALVGSIGLYFGLKILGFVFLREQTKTLKQQMKISKSLDHLIELENKKRNGNPYVYVLDKYLSVTGTFKYTALDKNNVVMNTPQVQAKLMANQRRTSIKSFNAFQPIVEWKFFDQNKNDPAVKYRNSTMVVTSVVEISDEQAKFHKITGEVNKEGKLLNLSQNALNKLIKKRTAHLRRIIDLKCQDSEQVKQSHYESQSMKSFGTVCSQSVAYKKKDMFVVSDKQTFYFDKTVVANVQRENARRAKAKAKAAQQAPTTVQQEPLEAVQVVEANTSEASVQEAPVVTQVVTPQVTPVVVPVSQEANNIVAADFGMDPADEHHMDIQNSYEEEPQYG